MNLTTITGVLLSVLLCLCGTLFCLSVTMLDMLPLPLCGLMWGIVAASIALLLFGILKKKNMPSKVIAVLLALLFALGSFGAHSISSLLNSISDVDVATHAISVYVLRDDPAQNLSDARNYTFGIIEKLDRPNTDLSLNDMQEQLGSNMTTVEYGSPSELTDALLSQDVQAMVINDAYLSILEEQEEYEGLEQNIRRISFSELTTEIPAPDTSDNDTFVLYFSGSDTRGELQSYGNTDVNLLMVINRKTGKILLVNTPRDYYVQTPVSGDDKDKLTHAGVYGIDVSMGTLEMLYHVPVQQYVRINFIGFKQIIDALGGITVDNPREFTSGNVTGYHFDEGLIDLDGEAALAFVRERYAFSGGDRTRGENQALVLRSVIQKLADPAILPRYLELMEYLGSAFETNMTREQIGEQVQYQIIHGTHWNVESISVDGSNDIGNNYSMPNSHVYRMIPDMDTVINARQQMREVLELPPEAVTE